MAFANTPVTALSECSDTTTCRLPSLQFPMANCQYCDCFILSHILQSVSGFTVSI